MVYSLDLRQRALNYIANGGSRSEASKIFGVTARTLANWLSRQKQQDLAPKMNGSNPSKIDNEKLKKYIEEHPDRYLREIAEVFGSTLQAVFYACKRLNITLKKRPLTTKKEMRKNERYLKKN
jgi:transposase